MPRQAPAPAPPKAGSKAEVERARSTLRDLVELSGMSRREVRRRLAAAGCGMNLAGLLSGRLDLKLRHVLDLGRVLGVEPGEFFRLVFGEPSEQSPLLRRLEELVAPGRPRRLIGSPAVSRQELAELGERVEVLSRRVGRLAALVDGGDLPESGDRGRGGRNFG
jgi:hypothetical protein